MRILLPLILLASAAAVFALLVLRRAWQLRRLARAVSADRLGPIEDRPPILRATARHEATFVDHEGSRISVGEHVPFVIGELVLTDRDLFLRRETTAIVRVPLDRVFESLLIQHFGDVQAKDVGGILRVDWSRGGARVSSVFAIDGTVHLAEQLRREIHLRAGQARHPVPALMTEARPGGAR